MKEDLFRDQIAAQLRVAGRSTYRRSLSNTIWSVRLNGVPLGGIETKTGNSRYTPSQHKNDEWIAMHKYPINLLRQK